VSRSATRSRIRLLLLGFVAAGTLRAQAPIASRVRVDNDAFDFWLAPWNRPDEEYTSGVEASLRYSGYAWWHRAVSALTGRCTRPTDGCATRTYALGQQIYTAAQQVGQRAPTPGSRPSAGWLYASEAEQVATASRLDESSLTIGVTGAPALASFFQRVAHGYAAAYNRPVDWSRQLPFEPGATFRFERTERLVAGTDGGWLGAEVEPHVGAALGTIITEGVAGVRTRVALPARHPWLPGPPSKGLELSLFADAEMHGVARNEFLDGTFFRSSDHVRSRPWVSEFQGGFTVRWRQLGASYAAHRLGPEYVTRTGSHTWASISAEWRLRE
jgi:hypothetical protein